MFTNRFAKSLALRYANTRGILIIVLAFNFMRLQVQEF